MATLQQPNRHELTTAPLDAPLYERLDAECNRLEHQPFARKVVALMREAAAILRRLAALPQSSQETK